MIEAAAPLIEARGAGPADAPELIRLRAVMLAEVTGRRPEPGPWQAAAVAALRERLAEPDGSLAAYVVDRPAGRAPDGVALALSHEDLLAACVVGTIEQRLPGPDNPTGVYGYVFNVATDLDCRRRGYARACLVSLLDWYRRRGVSKVDLRASPVAEPLYRSLGFARTADPAMRLYLR